MSIVSVIIPMYNAEDYISATLNSILQEYEILLEVIVVDDKSTDSSADKVREIKDKRVQIIAGSGEGAAAALNLGLNVARGEIIVRCDADDLLTPGSLQRQTEWLLSHQEFGAVCGQFIAMDPKGNTVTKFSLPETPEEITAELRNGITRTHLGTFAVRAEVFKSLGGYRKVGYCEDIDMQLRIGEHCRVWYEPQVEYQYRLHDSSLTHTQRNIERNFFDSYVRELQQQRLAEGNDELQRGCPLPIPPGTHDDSFNSSADHIQNLLIGKAWQEHKTGYKWQAIATGFRSVMTRPSSFKHWRSLIALTLKTPNRE